MMITKILWIIAGSSLGALCRTAIFLLLTHWHWPLLATFFVNGFGSFLAGLVISLTFSHQETSIPFVRFFFMIGFLGSFTTFSAFSLDLLQLCRDMQFATAALHMALNVAGSLVAVACGFYLGLHYVAKMIPL